MVFEKGGRNMGKMISSMKMFPTIAICYSHSLTCLTHLFVKSLFKINFDLRLWTSMVNLKIRLTMETRKPPDDRHKKSLTHYEVLGLIASCLIIVEHVLNICRDVHMLLH